MNSPLLAKDLLDAMWLTIQPASEVWAWMQREILASTGSTDNEEHARLIDANIQVMRVSSGLTPITLSMAGDAFVQYYRAK